MNVLRYRGYVYDEETNLYYLQSRYYSPETCRFINSDTYVSTGTSTLGYNMFLYCDNNPVSFVDPTGESILGCILIGALIGGVIGGTAGGVVAYNAAASSGIEGEKLVKETLAGVGKGAIIGGILGGLLGGTTGVAMASSGFLTNATATVATYSLSVITSSAEVSILQGKYSKSNGRNNWQIASDCMNSIFSNGWKIAGMPSLSKTAMTAGKFVVENIWKHKVIPLTWSEYMLETSTFRKLYVTSFAMSAITIGIAMSPINPIKYAEIRGYHLQ